jgi:hypothetical protein
MLFAVNSFIWVITVFIALAIRLVIQILRHPNLLSYFHGLVFFAIASIGECAFLLCKGGDAEDGEQGGGDVFVHIYLCGCLTTIFAQMANITAG